MSHVICASSFTHTSLIFLSLPSSPLLPLVSLSAGEPAFEAGPVEISDPSRLPAQWDGLAEDGVNRSKHELWTVNPSQFLVCISGVVSFCRVHVCMFRLIRSSRWFLGVYEQIYLCSRCPELSISPFLLNDGPQHHILIFSYLSDLSRAVSADHTYAFYYL